MRNVIQVILPLALSLISSAAPEAPSCIKRLGAIDAGSEGIRMRVADVDTCANREVRPVLDLQEKIQFKKSLVNSTSGSFSTQVLDQGIRALKGFRSAAMAIDPKPVGICGVATGAFRQATNAGAFVLRAKAESQVGIKIVNPEQEGILAYHSAVSAFHGGGGEFLVWGVGGASQQLTVRGKNGFEVYWDELGSVAFKDLLMKKKGLPRGSSPNPMSASDIELARTVAMDGSRLKQLPLLKSEIARRGGEVVGVGGVLVDSLAEQVGRPEFDLSDLEHTLSIRSKLTDAQIAGPYPETQVTNLILAHTLMKELGIKKVRTIAARNTSGVLVDRAFWQSPECTFKSTE